MKLINPVEITPSDVLFHNISDTYDAPYFESFTTYSIGDRVVVAATNTVYESLLNNNQGTYPPAFTGGENPAWFVLSASNPWKAFDQIIGTQTVGTSAETTPNIKYEILTRNVTGVALLNVSGAAITVTMEDIDTGEVWTNTTGLSSESGSVYNWWSYFFPDFDGTDSVVHTNIPKYAFGKLTIEVDAEAAHIPARLGELVIGYVESIGATQYSPQYGIIDYSKKTVDSFGNATLVERAFSKRIDVSIIIETYDINRVTGLLTRLRAKPVIWIPTENADYSTTLTVYGYFRDFSTVIPHPIWAQMSLRIEGLI